MFELIGPGQYVMDEFEYDWSYVCKRADYLKLGKHLQRHGISSSNSFKLYNSGLCGVRSSDTPLLETSIRLIEEWTTGAFEIHTIEQVAISFAMRGNTAPSGAVAYSQAVLPVWLFNEITLVLPIR